MLKRCEQCKLYGCRHVNPRLAPRQSDITELGSLGSLGDFVGEPMQDFSGIRTRVANPRASNDRVIIPPTVPPVNRELQSINMQNEWVNCNICKSRVFIKYLDQHLRAHTHTYQPTSTAIVKVEQSNVTPQTIVSTTKKEESIIPKLDKPEPYRFRQLEQACCASSVSNDGRYSDFTIVFWEKDKQTVQSTVYSGGNTSYTTKDWERFSVHVVYDSLEDYFTLACKLLRRSAYGTWDNEDAIPDRICYQDELITEIKRALLFFRISPKDALDHFIVLWNEQQLIISYDENGRAFITQTENCRELDARLKKNVGTNGNWNGRGHADSDCY